MNTPFLGCAYYPEDWDACEIPKDIAKMKETGIKCARIGEFAWRKMEPRRGEYDFAWLHDVVDQLHEAGIAVVMGTPTATPPIWLSRRYPDVLSRNWYGLRTEHGGRRHCCSNNPHYLEACDAIVEKMAQEFGRDPAIIGWQIDNEIYTGDTGCVCEYCMGRFRRRLKEQYGSIENLNARWNLNLFSQAYDDFSDIPPAINAWHNPHIKYEWMMAHHQANIEFVHRQYDILKKYTDAPVGTDMMPINGMSYEEMTDKLDVVMFNHYNVPENLNDAVFWFDFLRTLKDRPFWNTETATVWNGSTAIGQFLKPEGYCRINSWLPVALGGESNMYWLWRQHWAGHELVHGAVLTPEGRPMHAFSEIQQTAREYEAASEVLNRTKVTTPAALHFTSRSWNLFEQQKLFDANNYPKALQAFHHAIAAEGLIPDVIGSEKDLAPYRVLFSPMLMTLEDSDLGSRIRSWVEAGGVWVAGPMTDIRNDIGAHYTDRAMGMLEDWLGIRLDAQIPDNHEYLQAAWTDGSRFGTGDWVECYTVPESAEILTTITAGHSALNGKAVSFRIPCGEGQVIIPGTIPEKDDLKKLIRLAYSFAGITPWESSGSVLVIPRCASENASYEDPDVLILCETAFKEASVTLKKPMTDVLTGEKLEGTITVKPYEIRVLI